VTLTGNPAELPHEVRAAKGVATLLLFKSQINGEAVEVDTTRVKILDAGKWSILFELLVEPGLEERLLLSVPFADGKAPSRAVFVLVSSPSEVDTRLEVVRREPTVEECQAELAKAQARCAKSSPIRFAREGGLTPKGVSALNIEKCRSGGAAVRGLVCAQGTVYRAEHWVLLDVRIVNKPGQPPWGPREVTLKSMNSEESLTVRSVELETAVLAPGAMGRVLVEVAPPKQTMGEEEFVLEVRDAAGRGLTMPEVKLSPRESKR
jgi:uncharacterized protein (TIGR02268 family)